MVTAARNGKSAASSSSSASTCDPLLVDARKVTITLTHINEHFICKLCNGYLCNAQAIKECLHTFCNGCILPHFMRSKTNNSCPTCHVDLGVRPWEQLIADPAIQELTRKLLPDYTEQDKIDSAAFYERIGIKRKRVDPPRVEPQATIKSKLTCGPSPTQFIHFQMYPQQGPELPLCLWLDKLAFSAMHTQAQLKIAHLRKYIAKKLERLRPGEVEILCRGAIMGQEYSLEFIRRTIWKDDCTVMTLEYRRKLT